MGAVNLTEFRLEGLRGADAWFCWKLGRDPVVRAHSKDSNRPTIFNHFKWMRRWGNWDENDGLLLRAAWIIWVGDKRAGVVNVSMMGPVLVLGISMAADFRGRGLASPSIYAATCAGWDRWDPGVAMAIIHRENIASIKSFERVGFGPTGYSSGDGFDTYVLEERPGDELWMGDT